MSENSHITHDGSSQRSKVLAAMSGGVDSSVMAQILIRNGYDVLGSTMALCESTSAGILDAKRICAQLGIEHVVFNFEDIFKNHVIDYFCNEYLTGNTPNPCIECNRHLKFAAMQRKRRELGYDYVASGHYARRSFDETSRRWQLLRAKDDLKDQSYFLYGLKQDDLEHMLFPLGELAKDEVRCIARSEGLECAKAPESQDICFVPDGDYVSFIADSLESDNVDVSDKAYANAFENGEIVDADGRVLGEHTGLIHYTTGQRKGIGVASASPLYVLAKDVQNRRLIVAHDSDMKAEHVIAKDINMVSVESIADEMPVQVKTHYRQKPVDAIARRLDVDTIEVRYAIPQRASSPGQSLVLYDGDVLLGGGIIV